MAGKESEALRPPAGGGRASGRSGRGTSEGESAIELTRDLHDGVNALTQPDPLEPLMARPLVSFLIPAYNVQGTIADTLLSLSASGISDYEIIVVDDGSSDNTFETARRVMRHGKDKLIGLKQNAGPASALNVGISFLQGLYIARIDADDIMRNQRVAAQITHLEKNPEVAFCGTHISRFGLQTGVDQYPLGSTACAGVLPTYCCYAHPSVTLNSERLKSQYYYDPLLSTSDDYEVWCRFLSHGVMGDNIDMVGIDYRIHANSYSYNTYAKMAVNDIRIRAQMFANILKDARIGTAMAFGMLATIPQLFEKRGEFVVSMRDLVMTAIPKRVFDASWRVTRDILLRRIAAIGTERPQQQRDELLRFCLVEYGQIMRQKP